MGHPLCVTLEPLIQERPLFPCTFTWSVNSLSTSATLAGSVAGRRHYRYGLEEIHVSNRKSQPLSEYCMAGGLPLEIRADQSSPQDPGSSSLLVKWAVSRALRYGKSTSISASHAERGREHGGTRDGVSLSQVQE